MRNNLSKILSLVFLLLVLTSFASAYVRSISYTGGNLNLVGQPNFLKNSLTFDKSMCQEGTDFVLQIAPYSCQPAVVRSDLLEEEDVSVSCQIMATQINPLVDVEAIKTMVITRNERVPGVKAIGYHPSQAAIGLVPSGNLDNPLLSNLGYVVITLKKNANESSMPDFVNGTLNARIRYDVKNAWGVGDAEFLLPEMMDSDWEQDFRNYGFWRGNGYLRASGITENGATIYIYADSTVPTSLPSRREGREYSQLSYSHYNLKVGKESPVIYLAGFNPCMAGLRLKLNSIEDPDTRVRLRVNGEVFEVNERQDFLDGKCFVEEIESRGLYEFAKIKCKDDEKGSEAFELSISPRVRLDVDGEQKNYEIGEKIGVFEENDGDKEYVYVGYVGSKADSDDAKDLFVVLISFPQNEGSKLNSDELRDISTYVKHRTKEAGTGAVAWDKLFESTSKLGSVIVAGFKKVTAGEDLRLVSVGSKTKFKNSHFSVVGFSEDSAYSSLTDSYEEYEEKYDNAVNDFGVVSGSYANEKQNEADIETLGEKSLYELIIVSKRLRLNQNVDELCIDFEEKYPESDYWSELEDICYNDLISSSSGTTEYEVLINGDVKRISFQRVIEPTFEEYGAHVFVRSPDGNTGYVELEKDKIVYLNSLRDEDNREGYEEEYISLISLDKDSAKVKIHTSETSETLYRRVFKTDTPTLKLGKEISVGGGYTFILNRVNLEKVARVSVNAVTHNEFSNSTFPYQIAIEKRAIQLSPEKINKKIDNLDGTIESLEKTVNFLEGTVTWGNRACLLTGAALQVKNFIKGMNGASIARTEVMQGSGGWNEQCQLEVSMEKYNNLDQCFLAHSPEIDKQVEDYARILNTQQKQIKTCNEEASSKDGGFLRQSYVDQELLKRCLADIFETTKEDISLETSLGDMEIKNGRIYKDPTKTGENDESIELDSLKDILQKDEFLKGTYSVDDLKEIEFYRDVLTDPSVDSKTKEVARKRLYILLADLNVQGEKSVITSNFKTQSGLSNVAITDLGDEETSSLPPITSHETFSSSSYSSYSYSEGSERISPGDYVYAIMGRGTGKGYLLVYDDDGIVQKTYSIDSSIEKLSLKEKQNEFNFYITKLDKNSFRNGYTNAKVQYFDSGSYEGYPAVVPFDEKNGWYAATKFVLGEGRNIASYDESGVVRFYYICNVGENGLEEYMGGDDSCGAINKADSFEDTYFDIISPEEKINLVRKAEDAIEDAQRASKNVRGKVKIGGETYEVGQPVFETSSVQCQDFMSPKDCALLYNVCDPFVCPSSRCDLGGNYPVRDVVQSGVIGSIALCYPNAKWNGGEVYVPVCVTGVYAGLDGWLQVKKAYRDCLQTQLDSGEVVGICDSKQSVFVCDFFYRQLRPFLQYVGTNLLNRVKGENTYRGGGEYSNVQSALGKAKSSLDYFKQYYAAEAYRAFKLRSTSELNLNDPCNTFSSVIFPNGADVLDSLTQARSPVQFRGSFDEIEMTTRTSPPISHYKVSYQIYAGNSAGAYYKVYLRGGGGGSYYFDTSFDRVVDSGYIGIGVMKTETKDFQGPAGYTKLCILVNGHEECGFKQVSTSFKDNYMKDMYLAEQAGQTDIRTEQDCISGTSSLYSVLLNNNPQAAAEELIDPAIYDRGISRVCRPQDPGLGTDIQAGTENARWVRIGYCNDKDVGCWLDTDSVEDVIHAANLKEGVLDSTSQSFLESLFNDPEADYLIPSDFEEKIKEFEALEERDYEGRVELLTDILDRLFWSSQKGIVYFLRGKTYADSIYVEECENICGEGNLYLAFKTSPDGSCEISGIVKEYCEKGCSRGICLEEEYEDTLSSGYNTLDIKRDYAIRFNRVDYPINILGVEVDSENPMASTVTFSLGTSREEITLYSGEPRSFDLDGDGENDVTLVATPIGDGDEQAGIHVDYIREEESQNNIIDYSIRCGDCKKGISLCDREKCAAIAEASGRDCVYTADVRDVLGRIITSNRQCTEEGGESWPPGFNGDDFNEREIDSIFAAEECRDCGKGTTFNSCDEAECNAVGIILDKNCVFTDRCYESWGDWEHWVSYYTDKFFQAAPTRVPVDINSILSLEVDLVDTKIIASPDGNDLYFSTDKPEDPLGGKWTDAEESHEAAYSHARNYLSSEVAILDGSLRVYPSTYKRFNYDGQDTKFVISGERLYYSVDGGVNWIYARPSEEELISSYQEAPFVDLSSWVVEPQEEEEEPPEEEEEITRIVYYKGLFGGTSVAIEVDASTLKTQEVDLVDTKFVESSKDRDVYYSKDYYESEDDWNSGKWYLADTFYQKIYISEKDYYSDEVRITWNRGGSVKSFPEVDVTTHKRFDYVGKDTKFVNDLHDVLYYSVDGGNNWRTYGEAYLSSEYTNAPFVDTSSWITRSELTLIEIPEKEPAVCTMPPSALPEILNIIEARGKVSIAIDLLDGTSAQSSVLKDYDKSGGINCWDSVVHVYESADVSYYCIYSDIEGKEYSYNGHEIEMGVTENSNGNVIFATNEGACDYKGFSESKKLRMLQKGDILSIVYNERLGHNVIFVRWVDEGDISSGEAIVFDWMNRDEETKIKVFGEREVDLSDNSHTIYMVWQPRLKSQ